jgi:hypothetical protein
MMELLAAEYNEEPLDNGELEGSGDDYSSQMEMEPDKHRKTYKNCGCICVKIHGNQGLKYHP